LSHGCVRVENPFDLAVFMLDNNKSVIGRIKYSMTVDSVTGPDKNKLIHSMKVMQDIPVFIVYYTLYPNRQGELEQYQDVYGYDQIIYKHLKNYMF
jgi:murein L,D-transpeptidase YcbB/YkuD